MAQPVVEITYQINREQLRKIEEHLAETPKAMRTMLQRAVNKGGRKAFTSTKRILSRELGVKQNDLTTAHRVGSGKGKSNKKGRKLVKQLTYKPAQVSDNPVAVVKVAGGRLPLTFFRPKEKQGRIVTFSNRTTGRVWKAKTRGGGVSYSIGKRGRKTVKQFFIGRGRKGQSESASEAASTSYGRVFMRSPWAFGARKKKRRHDPFLIEPLGPSAPYVAKKNPELRKQLRIDVSAEVNKSLASQWKAWKEKKYLQSAGDGSEAPAGGSE